MGFQFHKPSPKADWVDDCRQYLKDLTGDDSFELISLSKMTRGDISILATVLEDCVRDKRRGKG